MLGMSPLAFSSGDPRWATYKQAEDRGWQVRKGERGTAAFFFKRLELRDEFKPADDEDAVKRIPLLRAFTLFHASQIDGISDYVPPTIEEAPWRTPEAAEIILGNSRRCHQDRWRPCVLFTFDGSHPDAAAIGLRDGGRILRNRYA